MKQILYHEEEEEKLLMISPLKTTTTTIELTEKEEQIIHLGLGALAGLFGRINDDDNNKNRFHVKVTVDEMVKLKKKKVVLVA
jgi:hypothetical protein